MIGNGPSGARERRGAIDLARAASLLLVVAAHLSMVVLDRAPDGSIRGVNLFELYPRWDWLTILSPMPLFFLASGWANVGGATESRLRRVAMMARIAVVLVVGWSLATLVERALTGGNGIISDGSRISTQPLWFLTAWIPFTLFAPAMTRLARRIVPVLAVSIIVMAATDAARFILDAPRWVGYPGFFVAWSAPWLLGAWWRQRHEGGAHFRERRAGFLLLLIGLAASATLVAFLGYHAALIDAVPGHRSNTTPPTLFTLVASVVQVGVFMLLAPPLDRVATRRARGIRSLDTVAPGLYIWHLTSLALCGAALTAGVWAPTRLSAQWWFSRPPWFAAVLLLATAFALLTRRFAASPSAGPAGDVARISPTVVMGGISASVAFGLTGLYGPDTTGMAIAISALTLFALQCLSPRAPAPTREV